MSNDVTTGLGSANYLIRRATLTATISRDRAFRFDPTADAFTTYFSTNAPGFTADADAGRPIDLFGAEFRNGFAAETFAEDSPFGSSATGGRNAFAAGYSTNGTLVDVGNNLSKTNAAYPAFEIYPFAIGQAVGVSLGELVPSGTTIRFELNLADPFVRQYLQDGCNSGRLRFTITGLHTSEFGGTPAWPEFYTRDSILGTPPTLEIEGVAIRANDSDADGLPDDWEDVTSFGAATADGWLYVFGGHKGERHDYTADQGSGSFHRLKLSEGKSWETLPAAAPSQGLPLVTHGGHVYRIGGMAARNPGGQYGRPGCRNGVQC